MTDLVSSDYKEYPNQNLSIQRTVKIVITRQFRDKHTPNKIKFLSFSTN